jgi:hypothetical protein
MRLECGQLAKGVKRLFAVGPGWTLLAMPFECPKLNTRPYPSRYTPVGPRQARQSENQTQPTFPGSGARRAYPIFVMRGCADGPWRLLPIGLNSSYALGRLLFASELPHQNSDPV